MNKKYLYSMITLVILLFSILSGVFLYSYYSSQQISSSEVILKRTATGGFCSGEVVCESETILYGSGKFGEKKLSKKQVAKLKGLISNTEFEGYAEDPSPSCPSYLDGSDVGYTFPNKYNNENFVLCQHIIPKDDPLFSYLNSLY